MRREPNGNVGFQHNGSALNFSFDRTIRLYRCNDTVSNLEQETARLAKFRVLGTTAFDVDLRPESTGGSPSPVSSGRHFAENGAESIARQ